MPTVLGLEVDHGELARHEVDPAPDRVQGDLHQSRLDLLDRGDPVVVQRLEEPGQQFAIDVETEADGADRQVAPGQQRCGVERRGVHDAVDESGCDEQPGRPVQCPPPVIASEDAAQSRDAPRVSSRQDQRA
jgi:hypothetical protein